MPNRYRAGDEAQVKSIVASLGQYKTFRNMAAYNLACLLTHITPPTVGWRENVDTSHESGGAKMITEVLRQHPKALDIIKSATESLSGITTTSTNAANVAQAGGVEAALEAMLGLPRELADTQDGQEAQEAASVLLIKLAQLNPNAILDSKGGVAAVLDGLVRARSPVVKAACATVADRVGVSERGMKALLKHNALEALIAAIKPGTTNTEDLLKPVYRLLERFADDSKLVKKMRDLGVVEALVFQLESHPENETLLRMGGRLLAKVAGDDLEGAIKRLKKGGLSAEALEWLVQLVSNLALTPENIDRIVKQGGVKVLIDNFGSYNPKTKVAAARALARVANNPNNASEIINAGGVEVLVKALKEDPDNQDLVTAVSQALGNIATSSVEHANEVHKRGGLHAVLEGLNRHPEFDTNASNVMKLMEQLANMGFDVSTLVMMNAVESILKGMEENMENHTVQRSGFLALAALMTRERLRKKVPKTAALAILKHKNGCGIMVNSIETHLNSDAVVVPGIETLAVLISKESSAREKLYHAGALQAVVAAVYSLNMAAALGSLQSSSAMGGKFEGNVSIILHALVSPKEAKAVLKSLERDTADMLTGNEAAAERLDNTLMNTTVYSLEPGLAIAMASVGLARGLVHSYSGIVAKSGLPLQESVMSGSALAMSTFARSANEHLGSLSSHGATKHLVEAVRKHPKKEEASICAMRALRVFASSAPVRKKLVEEGAIEACVAAMRSNPESPGIALASLNVFLSIASADDMCGAVAYKGGTRQAIKMIMDNPSSESFERATERALLVLQRVAATKIDTEEVRSNLVKQGAVGAVTQAMESYPYNESIETIGARLLSMLLDKAAVEAEIAKMKALVAELKDTKTPEKVLPKLARSMATVGALALSPTNTKIMNDNKAANTLVDALETMDLLDMSKEREHARRAGFRALGMVGSMSPLSERLGYVELILRALKAPESKVSLVEKAGAFNCVKLLSTLGATSDALVRAGVVGVSMGLVKEHAHNEGLVTAGFGALGAIAAHKSGAQECTSSGCTALALRYLRNFGDSSGPRFSEEAMVLLGNLCLVEENIKEMLKGAVVDAVTASLDQHCSDPSSPDPRILTAAVTLLQRLCINERYVKHIVRKGAVTKAIHIANSSVVYRSDPECAEALLFLIETCALVRDCRETLVRAGAVDLVMDAMAQNGSNESVQLTGSKALQALLGRDSGSIKTILHDIQKLASQLKKKPHDKELQNQLTGQLRNLANLALVDGVISEKTAKDVLKTTVHATSVIQHYVADGPGKSGLLSASMQVIARTAIIGGKSFDSDGVMKQVLKVVKENPNDPMILESAMYAIGNLISGNPKAIMGFTSMGGMALVEKTLNEAAENEKLRDAATAALDKVRLAAAANASKLSKFREGANVLGEVAKALSNNPAALREFLKSIAKNPSGAEDLLAILGSDTFRSADPETKATVLKALKSKLKRDGTNLAVISPAAMAGIMASFSESTKNMTKADKEALLARQKDALDVLRMLDGPGSSTAFAFADGPAKLLALMNKHLDDRQMVRNILEALGKMTIEESVVDKMCDADAVAAITAAMRKHPKDEKIQQGALKLLAQMAAVNGIDKVGMDADTMRLINRTVEQFQDNRDIQKYGGSLLDGLSSIFKEDGADMIGSRLDASVLKMKAADHIQVLYDKDGKPYYFNTKTGETSWNPPDELASSLAALAALSKLTAAHKDNVHEVDPSILAGAIDHFKRHANEPTRLTDLAKTLGVLASNDANRDAMARAGGLEAIISALGGEHVDPDFLAAAIHLLNQFARNDHFKDEIAKLGGIEALILIMLKFIDHLEVVEKCMSTLANLAYNSKKNMKEVMKYKGPDAVQQCMTKYIQESPLLHFAMVLLSNLMYGSDSNKLEIGQTCGDEIVMVAQEHYSDPKLFRSALRALGNLSYCDENIPWIVQNGATKAIVQGMHKNPEDLETQQISIEVIGNFASFDEESDDVREKIQRGEQQSVYDIILLEGGAKAILDTVKQTDEPTLMMSGLAALGNLAQNTVVTEKLIRMGVVEMVFKAMLKYDWDEDLLERAVRLVAILTYSSEGVAAIKSNNGVQIILNAMETHVNQPSFLADAAAALKNIAADEELREEIYTLGGVQSTISMMESNMDSKDFLLEVVTLFVRLTRSEHISESIAQKGMNIILEAIGVYKDDISFLVPVYTLIGHLAFAPANLKIIVQYGGIDLIIDSILAHPESKNLVIRCIQTLDNIAMHSTEQSKIVIQAGGEQTIKEVIAAYSNDREVTQVGKSALLSMQPQVERRKAKPKYAFVNSKDERNQNVTDDPLQEYRNMFNAGVLLTHWGRSGPVSKQFYLKDNFHILAWKDPKKSSASESTMILRDVRNVRSGLHDGHKKGRRRANKDKAFTIIGRANTIDLEAHTVEDRERLVAGLQALVQTYKYNPQWLKKKK